ncbi:VDE domain-containing protein [Balamuthia mandrillaris]
MCNKPLFAAGLLLVLLALFGVGGSNAEIDGGRVCGINGRNYESKEAAEKDGTHVLHCGECGACSNVHDILIYNSTRNNLTVTTRECAYLYLFPGRWAAKACMQSRVGFTDECLECWLDNIECDTHTCVWVCIWENIIHWGSHFDENNPCIACDENNCGKPFIQCAGANRRRAGIKSDIDRAGDEVCAIADWELAVLKQQHEASGGAVLSEQ